MKLEKMTLGALKALRWKTTSEYVRLRDADQSGYCKCCTCEKVYYWREIQAGHWIPKAQGNSIYFELENIHAQCYRCNMNLGGNGPEYYTFMLDRYGQETIDKLKRLKNTTVKFSKQDHIDAIKDLREQIVELRQWKC